MDQRKTGILVVALILLSALNIVPCRAEQVVRHWESMTSLKETKAMVMYNDDVWVATSGGLLRIDPETRTHQIYTNIDGLATTRLYSLCVDDKNRLWVGGLGRLINFTDPNNPDGYLLTDRDDEYVEIYDIECSPGGDSLWLADRLGLTLFIPSDEPGDGLILENYTRFGDIERDTPARSIALNNDELWVGTDRGFAVGNRSDIRQLKTPSNWTSFFPSQLTASLDNDSIKGLVIVNDTIYIGGQSGIYRLEAEVDTVLVDLGMFGAPYIYGMSKIGDSVFVHCERSSQFYYNNGFAELPWDSMPIPHSTSAVIDNNGGIWNGNLIGGVYYLEGDHFASYDAGGMPANNCLQVIQAQGKFWAALYDRGLGYYENGQWNVYNGIYGAVVCLAVGPLGELWVGTWGEGVWRIDGDSLAHFNHTNSPLLGKSISPTFVVVSDMYATENAIWLGNLQGSAGELKAVNPYNLEQWQNYILVGGSDAEWIMSVAGGQDAVYVGTLNNGIYAVYNSGTPFYTEDDYRRHFESSNSGIGSNSISSLEVDGYDTLWVGTSFGLSYQALGEIFFYNINVPDSFGPQVTAIGFDGQGSLYAGSNRGLAARDIATGEFEHLTTQNSGLVDDIVNDIYYEQDADRFWISTPAGISLLTMPYKLATQDIDAVLAYPNPFIIRYGNETVRFNFSGLSIVRIFTLAGELVKEIPVTGEWDGTNSSNEPVASGVYIYTLTDQDGNTGRGKLFLIRE